MSEHTHTFPNWPFTCPVNSAAFCTTLVVHEHLPVLRIAHDANGDWQFLDATTDDPGAPVLLCMGCVLERDPSLAQVCDLPLGWAAARAAPGEPWERWEQPANDIDDSGELDEVDGDAADAAHHCDSDTIKEKALANIAQFGLQIISVSEDGELPPFSYTLGIEKTLGQPELIVIGLRAAVAHVALNECYWQMKEGMTIAPGTMVADLLGGGFQCQIGEVSPGHYDDYMGFAIWLHEGKGFRACQIIFPSTDNVFPWEPDASDWFRNRQPILAKAPAAD